MPLGLQSPPIHVSQRYASPVPFIMTAGAGIDAGALLRRLRAAARHSPAAATEALARASFPLIRPGRATFAFQGGAEAVVLLRWIHAGVDRAAFTRVGDSDLWLLDIAVEDGGRFEYKLGVTLHGSEHWLLDPLNPARAADPFGENSVCQTFGYTRPAWSMPQGMPAGRLMPLELPHTVFGTPRVEQLYLPAGHDPARPAPLLIIHDGMDFATYADLGATLDNLIAAGDIPPLVAALVQSPDRMAEYTGARLHARYIVDDLLPAIADRTALSPDPMARVLLGASLGAVAALSTALRHPGSFGSLALMSGSFILDPTKLSGRRHPVFLRIARLVTAIRRLPTLPPLRVFVSTGELEGLADQNRALADHLRARGVDVLFRSAWDGHHWHNWRDQLRPALTWAFGGQTRPDKDA
ncbi:MAG: alpha/beta hydrolase-fold protein [Pseudomonadota bacterium]